MSWTAILSQSAVFIWNSPSLPKHACVGRLWIVSQILSVKRSANMSEIVSVHLPIAIISAVERQLQESKKWYPAEANGRQREFIRQFVCNRYRTEASELLYRELEAWIESTPRAMNHRLRREGVNRGIGCYEVFNGHEEFCAFGSLSLFVRLLRCESTAIKIGDVYYPAVVVPKNSAGIGSRPCYSIHFSEREPVIQFPVRMKGSEENDQADNLFIIRAHKALAGPQLAERIERIRKSLVRVNDQRTASETVVLPMIDVNCQDSGAWMRHMWVERKEGRYSAALAAQRVQLRINQKDSLVSQAPAGGLVDEDVRSFIVQWPFFLWIERPGVTLPIIYAYLDQSSWGVPMDNRIVAGARLRAAV